MKIKLDENLGLRGQQMLIDAGHDACTVYSQNLSAADDHSLIDVCRREGRALVTLDMDFANPLTFLPSEYPGIAVIRLPRRPSASDLIDGIATLVRALASEQLAGHLWIIEHARIRVYQQPD